MWKVTEEKKFDNHDRIHLQGFKIKESLGSQPHLTYDEVRDRPRLYHCIIYNQKTVW